MTEKPKFVDLWGWYNQFRHQAIAAGDELRAQLPNLYEHGRDKLTFNNDEAMALFTQGRDLAEKLQEPCWMLFFDYWRCEVAMFYKTDKEVALDIAVKTVVESRKPQYKDCPVRARVYRIMIDGYRTTDPVGYANQIRDSVDYLEKQVLLDIDTWRLLEGTRARMAVEFDDLNTAFESGLRYLERSGNDDFRLSDAYNVLCTVVHRQHDMDSLLVFAQEGEKCARRSKSTQSRVTEFLAWQAVAMRKNGDEAEAQRLYDLTMTRQKKNEGCLSRYGYYIVAAYQELGGKLDAALRFMDQLLKFTINAHSLYEECHCRYHRCRLLRLMRYQRFPWLSLLGHHGDALPRSLGLPLEKEFALAHTAAKRLIDPTRYLAKLERLVRGDTPDAF